MKPEIHLIIPQLFQPISLWQKDFLFKPDSPHLSKLLTQYQTIQLHQNKGIDASLFACLGFIDKELPSAYYRSQTHADDLKTVKSGGGVFNKKYINILCADPVHLEVGMNDITLTDRVTSLSDDEAKGIINALNKHFNQDGLEFIYGSAGQWYLSLPAEKNLSTTPVDEVLRKNIAHYLPSSDDRNWQMIQNEVQMLLHSLAINHQREIQGLVTVNSLWFWGGGQTQSIKQTINSVYSTVETQGKMLAQAAQCDYKKLERNTDIQALIKSIKGRNTFILDQLSLPAVYDDVENYQGELSDLDEQFIKPLLGAWRAGQVDLIIDGCDGKLLKPISPPVWKFWAKKPTSLLDIARELN